jgi:hypothetical protein
MAIVEDAGELDTGFSSVMLKGVKNNDANLNRYCQDCTVGRFSLP